MEMQSDFEHGNFLPRDHTCQGSGSPPPLEWNDVPAEAKSLVLICDDPDAPRGIFYHWGVYNLPTDMTSTSSDLSAGDYPQAMNDRGSNDYHPPCPPPGDGAHRYRFHILALDVEELDFEDEPTVEELVEEAESHVIDRGIIVAQYQQ